MAKTTKLIPFLAAQDVRSWTAVTVGLPDPRMDRCDAGGDLLREVFGAPSSSMQLDDLLPESRRVRVPCSWHLNTFPLQSNGVHETGGTPGRRSDIRPWDIILAGYPKFDTSPLI